MKSAIRSIAAGILIPVGLFAQTAASSGQVQNPPQPAQPQTPPCVSVAPKKPGHFGFHLPRAIQTAVNKQLGQIEDKTGVAVDRNAANQAVIDAQKEAQGHPCPAVAPAPAAPTAAQK